MAFVPTVFYVGAPAGGPSLLYTGPGSSAQVIVKEIVLTNASAGPKPVSIWLVPNGGSPDNTNVFVGNVMVQPGYPLILALSSVIGALDTIQGSSVGVAIRISGVVGP